MTASPFGVYLRSKRTEAGKSLREVADALSITHVYLGEVERGRRRALPERHWKKLAKVVPGITVSELKTLAAMSEPIDPASVEGPSREVVLALARKMEEGEMSEALAARLLGILRDKGGEPDD